MLPNENSRHPQTQALNTTKHYSIATTSCTYGTMNSNMNSSNTNTNGSIDIDSTHKDIQQEGPTIFQSCSSHKVVNRISFLVAISGILCYCALLAKGEYFTFAIPLLAAASLCRLLSVDRHSPSKPLTKIRPRSQSRFRTIQTAYHRCTSKIIAPYSSSISRIFVNDAHRELTLICTLFILLPISIYLIRIIADHILVYEFDDDDTNRKRTWLEAKIRIDSSTHMRLANDFGKCSIISMSFFLVPVSRHSALLQALGIKPSHATRLHVWGGCIAIVTGIIHGLYWVWNWFYLDHLSLSHNILPARECWKRGYGKTCHIQFVNLLGIVCGVAFVGLAVTSLWWVRRNFYKIFFLSHILFSTILLFGLLMHYNKMIWYFAPSFLYYVASSVPVHVEGIKNWCFGSSDDGGRGVNISKVVHIADSGGCVEVSIPMDDNHACSSGVENWRVQNDASLRTCGKYVRVCVPEVSVVSHPFTVFSSHDYHHQYASDLEDQQDCGHGSNSNEMKILFRACGSFTKQLSNRLIVQPPSAELELPSTSTSSASFPNMLVDGLYGGSDQFTQAMQHDTIVIIAGGVGIVSYISLLSSLRSSLQLHIHRQNDDFNNFEHNVHEESAKQIRNGKCIIVHWVCRDEGLIRYIMQHYFPAPQMTDSSSSSVKRDNPIFNFVVHHTNSAPAEATLHQVSPSSEPIDDVVNLNYHDNDGQDYFEKSTYTALSIFEGCKGILQNIIPMTTFSCIAWGGLWIVHYCYKNIQDKHIVETRLFVLLAVVAWSFIISVTSLLMVKIGSVCRKFAYSQLDNGVIISNLQEGQEKFGNVTVLPTHASDQRSHPLPGASSNISQIETQAQTQLIPSGSTKYGCRIDGNDTSITHCQGRPNMANIIKNVLKNENMIYGNDVGIFMCGPPTLIKYVRDCIDELEDIMESSKKMKAAVYEEKFEL